MFRAVEYKSLAALEALGGPTGADRVCYPLSNSGKMVQTHGFLFGPIQAAPT